MSNNLQKDNQNTQKSNKSTIAILVLTGVVLFLIILGLILSKVIPNIGNGGNANNSDKANTTVGAVISVVDEKGNQDETINAEIDFRDVKFGSSIKKIKKMESKLDDTLDNPSTATSNDGYTYLTYSFNKDTSPEFFGTTVSTTSNNAILVYVFYNNSLIEVRVQYGAVGTAGYNAILAASNNSYGQATYSRSYTNGAMQSWWKTSDVTLDVIYQDEDVIAYYKTNNK